MDERRLFAGIDLGATARTACAEVARRLSGTGFDAKYVPPENFHVTLAFLGNVAAGRCEEVSAALAAAVRRLAPFSLALDRLGAFPHERRPRVVYVGAREQGEPFRSLAAQTRAALAALGFEFENDAVAHVTIARVKGSVRPLPLVEVAPIELRVESLALFESRFDAERATPRYETVATAPLRDAR